MGNTQRLAGSPPASDNRGLPAVTYALERRTALRCVYVAAQPREYRERSRLSICDRKAYRESRL